MRIELERANLARAEGRYDQAGAGLVDVVQRWRQIGEGAGLAELVCLFAILHIARGAAADAVRFLAAASTLEGPIGTVHMLDVRVEAPQFLAQARAALGDAGFAAAWAEGQELTLDQALTLALGDSARGQ